jgi:hypothetical protein
MTTCIYRSVAVTVRCCQFAIEVVYSTRRKDIAPVTLSAVKLSAPHQEATGDPMQRHGVEECEGTKNCICFAVETSKTYYTTLHISINRFPFVLQHKQKRGE